MKTKPKLPVCAIAVAALALISCGPRTGKKTAQNSAVPTVAAAKDSAGLAMDLSNGYAMTGIRKDSAQTVWLQFDSPGNEILYGRIILPGEGGNVRFNQIISPDDSMDGPFGRDITYGLTGTGAYRLSIGESLMLGDPYAGEFTVELFTGKNVPYKRIPNYFVRNDIEDSDLMVVKITSEQDFEVLFGGATTMSSRPEKIDFAKQYLVAIIGQSTDITTEFGIESALLKGGILTAVYRRTEGEKRSYMTRPFVLIGIDKQYDGALRVIQATY